MKRMTRRDSDDDFRFGGWFGVSAELVGFFRRLLCVARGRLE